MVEIDLTSEGLSKGNFLRITTDDKLRAAQDCLRDKDLKGALEKIAEALLAAPKRVDVLTTYAEIAEARGHLPAAIGIAEAAVAHNPESADARLMLTQRYMRAGRLAEGRETAREATRLQPGHVGAHLCLADILWREGRLAESVATYRVVAGLATISETEALRAAARALESGLTGDARRVTATARHGYPRSERLAVLDGEACIADGAPSEALAVTESVTWGDKGADLACVRARALIDCARLDEAERTLDAWPDTHGPRRADIAALRAVALRLRGDTPAARDAYTRAMREAGGVARLRMGKAVSLRALGLTREALSALDKIDSGDDGLASCMRERAALLGTLGRPDEAAEAARHADITGRAGDLVDGPALLDTDLEPAMAPEGMRAILTQGALSEDERIGYGFALGHAESGRGNPGAAMQAWRAANTRVRERFSFNVTGLTRWMQAVPEVVRAWEAPAVNDPVEGSPSMIFIVGMPRTGTSLVEHVLAAHPDVDPAGEARTVGSLIADIARCFPDATYPHVLRRLDAGALRDLRRHVLTRVACAHPGAAVVTDKMPGNFVHLGLLARLFPDAVFVTCARDPLDTALSIYTQWFREAHHYAYDMAEIGEVLRTHAEVMAAWDEQLPTANRLHIGYEDLVSVPDGVIGTLLRACGLAHADACFQPWRHGRHLDSGSARRVHQPITQDRVGRWRHHPEALEPVRARVRGETQSPSCHRMR